MENDFAKSLKTKASPSNKAAIEELERRGFVFLQHFGVMNAVTRLDAMNRAIQQGRLYEHLYVIYGLPR